ncbi:Vomeronasal type-2 receptor 26 [Tupaia chinensis]|uniref:Vomeronasal type-2 receptor 26 n=1 Tax=Tupaia chinensis TaxID=246437 RepID=L8Y4N3_TUPCH|nr:Vomeronasal type-2 receptor 26 [Tupaia chinensis]
MDTLICNPGLDAEECIQCLVQEYPNSERTQCLPKPVIFLDFEDSLGIAMACMALCFSVVTAIILGVFVKHRDTPIVKANNQTLTFILLISLLLCFLCSLLFIGHPNTATCILQQVTFALVFTIAISTVLAKTITVILAFKAMKPGRILRYFLLSGASNSVIPICSLIQVIICVIWLGTSPPYIDIDLHTEPRSLIIMCNKGSVTAFYCVLGYLGILALGSFTVAFLARNLPDTFNEAKFLTFSMLVFCSVWITFLPVYHSTKGKFTVAVEVFSILASSVGLLGCIFAPKCYIILIRPDKNSWKTLKNRRDAEECIQCLVQEYPNSERTQCLPKPVIFLDFEDSLGIAMACMALCFSVVTAIILGVFVKHRDTPIVKANNQALTFILLISLLFCFLCSLLFIGHPNTATCILQQVTFALVFTIAISTVLAKTITVILAFKAMKPGRILRYFLLSGASNSVIPICSLIQVIICVIWLGTSPPYIDIDLHTEPRSLIIMCNKGSVTAFYCVLGYLGILALGSFTVAFLARNLPDTFNEAKFLTFSMLMFCSVWITFLPVYNSTKGKVMVIVEVFSILASSAGLLACIFGPKCYIILIRPDKNSWKTLKNRRGPGENRHSKI